MNWRFTMSTSTPASLLSAIPGYTAGTWVIDPVHSDVSFTVRHLVVSKVRGNFRSFQGEIVLGPDPLDSSVSVSIDMSSIDTGNADRDTHVRSPDFFDVEQYPTMTYRSTGVRPGEDGFVVEGELSLHGVTKPVELALEVNGFQPATPFGDSRVGFSATTEIDRSDFDISFNMLLEGGGLGLGEKVKVALEVEAVLQV
jgi:polyisoprenoid-binding protein YceI